MVIRDRQKNIDVLWIYSKVDVSDDELDDKAMWEWRRREGRGRWLCEGKRPANPIRTSQFDKIQTKKFTRILAKTSHDLCRTCYLISTNTTSHPWNALPMLKPILTSSGYCSCSSIYCPLWNALWNTYHVFLHMRDINPNRCPSRIAHSQSTPQSPLIGQFGNFKIKVYQFFFFLRQ